MNHILLPGNADFHQFNESARYGIHAMELLINEMLKLGALRNRLVAKIFGGAHVLAGVSVAASPGQKNVAFVREYLGLEGIRLLSQDTGGTWTRVIRFHTDTFEVFVKRVQSATVRHLLVEEEKFRHQADEQSRADTDITFF
jgi:chemotaxis protein CheD